MSFSFPFNYDKEITFTQDTQSVFSFLKNYPSALLSFFPGLQRFEKEGPQTYFWEFEAIKYKGNQLQISFRTRFEELSSRILIHPEPFESGTQLSGEWAVTPAAGGSRLKMFFHLNLMIPLPKLMKPVVAPLASLELSKLFEQYAKNLQEHFR